MAVTFDDGPSPYTASLISQFDAAGFNTTLFVNGYSNPQWCIYDSTFVTTLRNALPRHQIASHTFTHQHLPLLSSSTLSTEFDKTDTAMKKILGLKSTFFRPPFGELSSAALTTAASKGFTHAVMWDKDSMDANDNPMTLAQQKAQYTAAFEDSRRGTGGLGHIFLNHDIKEATVRDLVPFVISEAKRTGVKLVTVGECLGVAKSAWYREVGSQGARDSSWTCA
ncbi:hypothetical protein HK097_010964 [Rhizophlyctis rosea]|uniref:NodB homology domain-containing protein n=1 Tax=Rhizophlyctis rosea TaxID=64517 RepID=A0AAD5S9A3_9FUNG|nr:hypothetical protein HK097_010964 [Rhizophlyctis rosea]